MQGIHRHPTQAAKGLQRLKNQVDQPLSWEMFKLVHLRKVFERSWIALRKQENITNAKAFVLRNK